MKTQDIRFGLKGRKERKNAEALEHQRVLKMIEKKDNRALGRWIDKFSKKGSFWLGDRIKDKRSEKNAWL